MGLFFRASFVYLAAACHVTCVFIHTPPSNVTAFEGDEVTLPCGTSRQKKGELVIWKKVAGIQEQVASINNRTTNSEKYYIRGTYDLVIREVGASDDGLYKCEAETNRATAYLSVSVPMQTLTLSSDVDFPLPSDSDVKLTCSSRHSHPPADIRWFRGQRELTDVNSVTSKIFQNDGYGDCESTITVHMRTGDDDIPFRCVADLPAKIAVQEAFLFPIVTIVLSVPSARCMRRYQGSTPQCNCACVGHKLQTEQLERSSPLSRMCVQHCQWNSTLMHRVLLPDGCARERGVDVMDMFLLLTVTVRVTCLQLIAR